MLSIPQEVQATIRKLQERGFEAYLVGGCVRDILLGRTPKDWDITTNAPPEEIQQTFEKTFYENSYGTVGIVSEEATDESLKVIEVTPYRIESAYSDKRHPDEVTFTTNLLDDLQRRDFTINAIAYDPTKNQIVDPHNGQKDIENRVIKAVGNPLKRFDEDALRMMRAIRLSTELNFRIDDDSRETIKQCAHTITSIASERIRDEITRILLSPVPRSGI